MRKAKFRFPHIFYSVLTKIVARICFSIGISLFLRHYLNSVMYKGEIISLIVALSWTTTAMFAEVASKRMGSIVMNVVRMSLSLIFLGITLWFMLGAPYPKFGNAETWFWLSLSGFVGYVFGDYCLFNSYIIIGSRFGQLFMTLAPPAAAIFGWILLGEQMTWLAILGMIVVMVGIGMSVLSKSDDEGSKSKKLHFKLPIKGVLFGIGAGMGQGIGLVLSKVGLLHYEDAMIAGGVENVDFVMPFAATFMRAVTGLVGFTIALFIAKEQKQFVASLHDKKAITFTTLATITGPFIGVSLSLMATLYTSTGVAQTLMSLTPVLILWPSMIFFNQKVTALEVIGALISVVGVTLFFI